MFKVQVAITLALIPAFSPQEKETPAVVCWTGSRHGRVPAPAGNDGYRRMTTLNKIFGEDGWQESEMCQRKSLISHLARLVRRAKKFVST
jgi:hypothetical protein